MEVSRDFVGGSPILSYHPAKFCFHRSYGTGNNSFVISIPIPVPIPIPIPMRRFQCRGLQMAYFLRNIQTARVTIIKWNKIRKASAK